MGNALSHKLEVEEWHLLASFDNCQCQRKLERGIPKGRNFSSIFLQPFFSCHTCLCAPLIAISRCDPSFTRTFKALQYHMGPFTP